jgi:phage terminase large subunit
MRDLDPVGYANQKQILAQMPDNLKAAYRYGKWDELGGNYFPEFSTASHVVNTKSKDFKYPDGWATFQRYRAFDYGLDMFTCLWVAVDTNGRSYVYREFGQGKDTNEPGLMASEAAEEIKNNTLPSENIAITYAPPDIWNTQKTDGKTIAEAFMVNGVGLVRANNNRVQGHLQIKEMLRNGADGKPMLMIFDTCENLISDLRDIQADERNPNDCAKEPHDITHRVDALRYYCISRTLPTMIEPQNVEPDDEDSEDYDDAMCGGEADTSYLTY